MASKNVYYWLDTFCPIPYFNNNIDGSSDYNDNTVYLIINFCIENSANILEEYLEGQSEGFSLEPLKDYLTELVDKEDADENDLNIIPVPPPLFTKIKVKYDTIEYLINSVGDGKIGYEFSQVEDKLDYVFNNGSFVSCEAHHLKDYFNSIFKQFYEGVGNQEYKKQSRQHKELKDWFVAFLTEVENTYQDPNLPKPDDTYNQNKIKIREHWSGADEEFWENIKAKIDANNALNRYLVSYLDYVLENNFDDDFYPPSFKYTKQQLLNIDDDDSGLGNILSPINNYVELLFDTFTKILNNPKEKDPEGKCKEQLQRFYGMGERLYISEPTSLAEDYHFMKVCDNKDDDGIIELHKKKYLVTNVFSLSGQVIRGLELIESDLSLARYPPTGETIKADDLISEKIDILINDGQSDNWISLLDDEDLKSSLRAAVKNAVDNNKNSFEKSISVTDRMTVLEFDEDDIKPPVEKELVKEKVQYVPVTGYGIPEDIELKINDEDRTLFKVPEFILDRLDKAPRMSLNSSSTDEKKLITLQSQRIFLKSDEVALEIKDPFLKNEPMSTIAESFQPAVFLQVKITKQKLPDIKIEGETDSKSKYIYKISRKLEVQQSEDSQQKFRDAFVTADERKKWYFGLNRGDSEIITIESPLLKLKEATDKDKLEEGIDPDELIEFYTFKGENLLNAEESSNELNLIIYEKEFDPSNQFNQFTLSNFFNGLISRELISDPKKEKPFLVLNNIFDYKFNQSVNAFSKFIKVDLNRGDSFVNSGIKGVDGKDYNPVLEDFPNFNELRLSLMSNDKKSEILVNKDDGIIPSSTSAFQEDFTSAIYGYQITHRFSQELEVLSDADKDDASGLDSALAESQRFMLYKNADGSYGIKGSLEHQYGHRIEVTGVTEDELTLGYSAPVKNIANLIGMAIPKEKDDNEERLKDTYAIGYELNDNEEKIESLKVFLNPEYFRQQLESQETIADDAKNYREIYEAILDFVNSNCRLVLECWIFDNTLNPLSLRDTAHPEKANQWPSVVDNMRLTLSKEIPLADNGLQEVVNEDFKTYKRYRGWIDEFKEELTIIRLDEDYFKDEWEDIENNIKDSVLIRLRLEVERNDSRINTVKSMFEFTTLPDGSVELPERVIKPMKIDKNEEIFSGLKSNATQYLKTFLSDSVLGHDSFDKASAYVYAKQAENNISSKKNNREELFGETLRFVTFPSENARNKTDTDLLYIPYAFVPLKIHSEIGDATSTLEFAQYLIRVLAALAYPERESQELEEIISLGAIKDKLSLLKHRRKSRKILEDVAGSLASLIDYVHVHTNENAVGDYEDYFPYVNQLSKNKAFKEELQKIFKSLLENNPSLFYTAKGFAIGLLPGNHPHFSNTTIDLYSLQITKEISDKATEGAQPYEQTRVIFKQFFSPENENLDKSIRLFTEILDDKIYDNEFQISEDDTTREFLVDKPIVQNEPIKEWKQIRAVQGRTVEDIIERQNFFSFQNKNAAKVSIKHFNPNWKSQSGEKYYLLPSRKPPVTPVPVSVLLDEKEKPEELQGGAKPFNEFKDGIKIWTHVKEKLESSYIISNEEKYEDNIRRYINNEYFLDRDFTTPNDERPELAFIDSYINYFYFIVEGDEEKSIEDELGNDSFAIYLEPQSQNIKDDSDSTESELFDALLKQFRYYSIDPKNRKGDAPDAIDIDKALLEGDKLSKTLKDLLTASKDTGDANEQFFLFSCSGDNCTLNPPKDNISQNRIVAIYIFKKSNEDEQKPNSFLIKIAVLTNTTSSHKCQMKVIRNARDFNEDGISDINQRFVMNSNLSPIVDYGIQHLEYDYVRDIENSYDWPEGLKYLNTNITLDEYFAAPNLRNQLIRHTIANSFIVKNGEVKVQVILSKRHGNAFMTSYGNPEAIKIKTINLAYSDKIDEFALPALKIENVDKKLLEQLSGIVTESSFTWFISATWFSEGQTNIPILTINWQLKWKNHD